MATLDAAEQELMHKELGSLLRRALTTGDWLPYQEALDGWIATAELKDHVDTSSYKTPDFYLSKDASIKQS